MHVLKNLVLTVLVTLLLSSLSASQDPQKRNSLLAKRAGNRNVFQKSTTTTAEPSYEEEEYVEGADLAPENDDREEDEPSLTSTTTTESSKKIGPSVRPFRSNQDLLSALKKRRLSEKSNKSSATPKPVLEEKKYEQPQEVKTAKPKATPSSSVGSNGNRRFGGHKPSNVKTPVQENQPQNVEEPAPKSFKRQNRFSSLRQVN